MTADAIIKEAKLHYGLKIVWTEDYPAVDAATGTPCFVTEWYVNGSLITAEGFKVRKNGTRYARKQALRVPTPDNVRAALSAIPDPTA